MATSDDILADLVGRADRAAVELTEIYEHFEAAYRTATTSEAAVAEGSGTAAAPLSVVTASASAR